MFIRRHKFIFLFLSILLVLSGGCKPKEINIAIKFVTEQNGKETSLNPGVEVTIEKEGKEIEKIKTDKDGIISISSKRIEKELTLRLDDRFFYPCVFNLLKELLKDKDNFILPNSVTIKIESIRGAVEGEVFYKEDGEKKTCPKVKVHLFIKRKQEIGTVTTTTDENGKFLFKYIEPGVVWLKIERSNNWWGVKTQEATVRRGQLLTWPCPVERIPPDTSEDEIAKGKERDIITNPTPIGGGIEPGQQKE